LGTAKAAYDSYRLANRAIMPELALMNASSLVPQLEATIRSQEIGLATARRSYTDDNIIIQQQLAQLAALRQQLAQAQATSPTMRDSVGQAVQASRQGEQLYRKVQIAQSLYDNYMRFLEGTDVEDLTATASVRILEPAFVDTARQINLSYAAIAAALLLLWGALEVYRWVPPVGERVRTARAKEEVLA
jgi:capsule polysaccharide export protein KpsE/RkpR